MSATHASRRRFIGGAAAATVLRPLTARGQDGTTDTPAIKIVDRLANQGMTFTDAHTASSICTPSRYGLLTGRYCWRSRVPTGIVWYSACASISSLTEAWISVVLSVVKLVVPPPSGNLISTANQS